MCAGFICVVLLVIGVMKNKAQLGSPEVGGVSKHLQNDGLTSRLTWAFLGLSNLGCLGVALALKLDDKLRCLIFRFFHVCSACVLC